jgi:universal stress protein A
MHEVKRILVVCRMPEYCREAVHHGVSLSQKFGAELSVMYVFHDLFIRGDWNLPLQLGVMEDEYKKAMDEAKTKLDAILREERKRGTEVKEIVREGKPSEEVLKVVKEEKVDLLIMIGHEESRLEHFLFGRDNEELLRKMPCSILMVKKEPGPA